MYLAAVFSGLTCLSWSWELGRHAGALTDDGFRRNPEGVLRETKGSQDSRRAISLMSLTLMVVCKSEFRVFRTSMEDIRSTPNPRGGGCRPTQRPPYGFSVSFHLFVFSCKSFLSAQERTSSNYNWKSLFPGLRETTR